MSEKQKKTNRQQKKNRLAIKDLIDCSHRNKLLLSNISNLSSAFRHFKPWQSRALRDRHCAAAVISDRVVSAACVSVAPVYILNIVFDFKVS